MLTGAVEVYANHPSVIIGSTSWPELDRGDGPAVADGRHVEVRTRGQRAHTRVSVWSRTMPLVGTVVFDGKLDLDDYTICVGDIERLGRWTLRIEQTGVQRVVVLVDDPGHASRVNVGLGIGTEVRAIPSIDGPALFNVLTAQPESLPGSNERGLVLDGHDSPHARLSAAIRLLSESDPARPWLEQYEAENIAEWMRWLGIELSRARAQELGAELTRLVDAARSTAGSDSHGGIPPQAADHIAATLLAAITK
ncbi:hypothetical protein [Rugosimonospora africana]|uniref:Uncharacterized protein n=1 Tax=Rugosimonospora africana TaxID=556532 RepID=A0A8J3VRF8_9ACTN|nr:hypothetical protein [Rugosimonospora africana]GIH16089.1 hypothetical protein Raf01_42610 [Rugosimonospora africana]